MINPPVNCDSGLGLFVEEKDEKVEVLNFV